MVEDMDRADRSNQRRPGVRTPGLQVMQRPSPYQVAQLESHVRALLTHLPGGPAGVTKVATTLEALLVVRFGAAGTGLGPRVRAVQSKLPEPLRRELYYIAELAEDKTPSLSAKQAERFEQSAQRCLQALLLPTRGPVGGHMEPVVDVAATSPRASPTALSPVPQDGSSTRGRVWRRALMAAAALISALACWRATST